MVDLRDEHLVEWKAVSMDEPMVEMLECDLDVMMAVLWVDETERV